MIVVAGGAARRPRPVRGDHGMTGPAARRTHMQKRPRPIGPGPLGS